jgi:hypothetical protein
MDDLAAVAVRSAELRIASLLERVARLERALEEIVRHDEMAAGESWNRAYVEVVATAREALEDQ